MISGVFFCIALKKHCAKIELQQKSKPMIFIKHSLKRIMSKSESEVPSEVF